MPPATDQLPSRPDMYQPAGSTSWRGAPVPSAGSSISRVPVCTMKRCRPSAEVKTEFPRGRYRILPVAMSYSRTGAAFWPPPAQYSRLSATIMGSAAEASTVATTRCAPVARSPMCSCPP